MNEKIFRVALVGCGVIAKNHLAALAGLPTVEIVALCDLVRERAERARDAFAPQARVYEDYATMLDAEHPDAVHIATPHFLHAPMAIEALGRDIFVFLEKPQVMTEEQIPALLDAEARSKAKVCVCFQNRTNPAVAEAKRIVREDGGVISAYGAVVWERSEAYYRADEWRGKIATEGGGALINQAIHTVDLLCYFLGKPEKVEATVANHHLKGVIGVEDTAEVYITFCSGAVACLFATTALPRMDLTSLRLCTAHRRIELRGDRLFVDDKEVLNAPQAQLGKACYGNGHERLIPAFYNAIAKGAPMPISAESARDALRVVLAAYRSRGEIVQL